MSNKLTEKQSSALKMAADFIDDNIDFFADHIENFFFIDSTEAEGILEDLKSIEPEKEEESDEQG